MYVIHWVLLILSIYSENQKMSTKEIFTVEFEWSHINYTWTSKMKYLMAKVGGEYIPENIVFSGIKLYNDKIYLTTPKIREGVPATLSYISLHSKKKVNNPLIPYPDWSMNDGCSCENLQSVQSMEIDTNGIMWVIDGVRFKYNTDCPCKLVLLDLNRNGKVVHTYTFPKEVCLQDGGYLNDIVLDGDYAYMTDTSFIDPGLIIYSKLKNKSWKLRDSSMFQERKAPKFSIDDNPVKIKASIDGIALSPKPVSESKSRKLFYSSVTGYSLFSIKTKYLKNEEMYKNGTFRNKIRLIGKKQGATDGMMVDSKGNLFYTLVSLNAVGEWNIKKPFNSSVVLYKNNQTMVWPDTFGMDNNGYIFMTSNHIANYLDSDVELKLSSDILFRVLKYNSNTKSYLYN